MVSDPWAKTANPAQTVVAVVLSGARAAGCRCSSGSARSSRSPGSWSLPGGDLAARRDARAVDPPAPRRQGRRARARPPRAARDPERPRSQPAPLGARDRVPRARPRPTSTRRCPADTRWHPVDEPPARSPSTTRRSCSPAASGCARSSPTRTSASRSRRPRSRSPSSATSIARRSPTTSRRRTCSACSLRRHLLVATGHPARARPGRRASGGALRLPLAQRSRSPISSRCCARLRPEPADERPRRPGAPRGEVQLDEVAGHERVDPVDRASCSSCRRARGAARSRRRDR